MNACLSKKINKNRFAIETKADHIKDAIAEAISIASEKETSIKHAEIEFAFNGVIITINANSNRKQIYRDYCRARKGYIAKMIGPNTALLTLKDRQSDNRIRSRKKRKTQKEQRTAEVARQLHAAQLKEAIKNAPMMIFKDELYISKWKQLKIRRIRNDQNTKYLFPFMTNWARLMQKYMQDGETLDQCAKKAFAMADTDDIDIECYTAISILSELWIYGDQLKQWHNLSHEF